MGAFSFLAMSTSHTIEDARTLASQGRTDEAIALLDEIITASSASSEALFLRGKLLWKLGRRAEATSDYIKATDIDPDGPASRALEMARSVESFFNPDLLNP